MNYRGLTLVAAATQEAATRASHRHAVGGAIRDPLLRRVLAVADASAVAVAVFLLAQFEGHALHAVAWTLVTLPVWILLAKLHGLYDRDRHALRHLTVDELSKLFAWAMSGTIAAALVLSVLRIHGPTLRAALLMWLATATSAFVLRGAGRWLWRAITEPERVVVLGEGSLAEAVLRKLALFPDIHAEIAGVHGPREIDPSEYERVLDGVDRVIVASSTIDQSLIVSLLAFCRTRRAKLTIVPPTHGMFGTAVELSHVADLPLVEFHTGDVPRSTLLLKRALDVVASAFALVVLSPLLLGIALAIRIDSCGPVMFTQRRAGQGGQPFRMYKFRTMVAEAEELLRDLVSFDDLKEPMFKLRNDPRVTRVGGFLRRTSLDELPQLLNVLKGEMSLVGPRPEQLELAKRYSEPQSFRLAVKPGLTGPMQVFGRGELTFEERLAVEREYIENLSLGRDLRIMVLTLPAVVSGKGAF